MRKFFIAIIAEIINDIRKFIIRKIFLQKIAALLQPLEMIGTQKQRHKIRTLKGLDFTP